LANVSVLGSKFVPMTYFQLRFCTKTKSNLTL